VAHMGVDMFRKPGPLDFVRIGRDMLEVWERERVFAQLVQKNRGGPRFAFLDGPITANNPMGVHHARGRTYKDVFQRYKAMRGFDQRFQNGFDCQGLWVEVEVEKALGMNGKREIEAMGQEAFARACRDRVLQFAALQTEQSRRLGQWMDWADSYYTMADRNIAYIWHFLAECHRRGWLYRGHRVMPWCVRCGTSISQHEMLESYAEVTHRSVVVALPVVGRENHALLAWTTTPWTLPANVALAVHPEKTYELVAVDDRRYYVAAEARAALPGLTDVRERVPGRVLVGLEYVGPFDHLEAARAVRHRVVGWDEVAADAGTGIVHVAPGCGQEDFELGRRESLDVVDPVDEEGRYRAGFGDLDGVTVSDASPTVLTSLRSRGLLFHEAPYRHRYPSCWRCGQELIFRLVDEWFLRADELRPTAIAVNDRVTWLPDHMRLRMRDWLTNMADWCISRKRFWGLPLPFYACAGCGHLTVVGSLEELRALAVRPEVVDGLPELHRPWIDAVSIRCPRCAAPMARVPEVGDCWLDAGVVPFSTLGYLEDREAWARWFPADFVVEMTAQIRGWFYAMLFMSVALEGRAPYRTVMAHERVLGGDGREMHKSWGNAIRLEDALDTMGPDALRYHFATQAITEPVKLGADAGREVTRRFLTLWNVYSLFVTYAGVDRPTLPADAAAPRTRGGLEGWILARLQSTVREVGEALDAYQLPRALRTVEEFVQEDLSNWYVRRRRRELWKGGMSESKALAYRTLFHVLVRLCQLLAPVMPFVADHVYRELTAGLGGVLPTSVHLTAFPEADPELVDPALEAGVAFVRHVVRTGLAVRGAAGLKVRQPLARVLVLAPEAMLPWLREFEANVLDELNVEAMQVAPADPAVAEALRERGETPWASDGQAPVSLGRDGGPFRAATDGDLVVALDTRLTDALERKGLARQLAHQVQLLRKTAGLAVDDRIHLALATDARVLAAVEEHRDYLCEETLALDLVLGEAPAGFAVQRVKLGAGTTVLGLRRVERPSLPAD
jgi:isoleucyl-tRNA synthetase